MIAIRPHKAMIYLEIVCSLEMASRARLAQITRKKNPRRNRRGMNRSDDYLNNAPCGHRSIETLRKPQWLWQRYHKLDRKATGL